MHDKVSICSKCSPVMQNENPISNCKTDFYTHETPYYRLCVPICTANLKIIIKTKYIISYLSSHVFGTALFIGLHTIKRPSLEIFNHLLVWRVCTVSLQLIMKICQYSTDKIHFGKYNSPSLLNVT